MKYNQSVLTELLGSTIVTALIPPKPKASIWAMVRSPNAGGGALHQAQSYGLGDRVGEAQDRRDLPLLHGEHRHEGG